MATLVAEELDADWAQVRVVAAPVGHLLAPTKTWPSDSVAPAARARWPMLGEQMRRMGAMARALLVRGGGAAARAGKPRRRKYRAGGQDPPCRQRTQATGLPRWPPLPPPDPASLTLKDPANFTLIGKTRGLHASDSLAKTNGSAQFSQDIQGRPDMLTVTIETAAFSAAKVAAFDAERALAVPRRGGGETGWHRGGLRQIRAIGAGRLKVTWDDARRPNGATPRDLRRIPPGAENRRGGEEPRQAGRGVRQGGQRWIEAEYTLPVHPSTRRWSVGRLSILGTARRRGALRRQIQTLDHSSCAIFRFSCRRQGCRLKPFWRAAASAGASI
ncbi:hypothetical protein M8494_11770 [Serratia ureilytica]